MGKCHNQYEADSRSGPKTWNAEWHKSEVTKEAQIQN